MILISIKAITININKQKPNRIMCFLAQGSKLPSPAEYKAAVPIMANIIIINKNKKLISSILFKFMKLRIDVKNQICF